MSTPYILHIPNQPNAVELQLLSPTADGRQTLHWQIPLSDVRSERDISVACFYNEHEFVLATTEGQIYRGDAQGNLSLFVELGTMEIDSGKAWMDIAKQEFWYCIGTNLNNPQHSDRLIGWSLPDWQPIAELKLPEYTDVQQLQRRSDGCFIIYDKHSRQLHQREHGFWCINSTTGNADYHSLNSLPAAGSYTIKNILAICPKRDLAILPSVDSLPSQNADGKFLLGFQLQLVDLNNFDTLWTHTVRWFDSESVELIDADQCQTLQAFFGGREYDTDDVKDGLEEWVESLRGIRFCEQEDAVWVCWKDDVLRKLYLTQERGFDLQSMSALLNPQKAETANNKPNPLNHVAYYQYDYQLQELADKQMIVINNDIKILDISAVAPCIDETTEQDIDYLTGKQADIVMSQEQLLAHTQSGLNRVYIDYLALPDCLLDGAQQMLNQTTELGTYVKGDRLEWLIEDRDGNARTEAQFAETVIELEGGGDLLTGMIDNFCAFEGAKSLRSGQHKAALSDMVLIMARNNIQHLPLLNRYFDTIDLDRFGKFHIQNTLPVIKQLYGSKLLDKINYYRFVRKLPTSLQLHMLKRPD